MLEIGENLAAVLIVALIAVTIVGAAWADSRSRP